MSTYAFVVLIRTYDHSKIRVLKRARKFITTGKGCEGEYSCPQISIMTTTAVAADQTAVSAEPVVLGTPAAGTVQIAADRTASAVHPTVP